MELKTKAKKRYYFKIKHPKYNGKLIFSNNHNKVKIFFKTVRVCDLYLYGFEGYLEVFSWKKTLINTTRKTHHGKKTRKISEEDLIFRDIITSVKSIVLQKMQELTKQNPEILLDYRSTTIEMLTDEHCGSIVDRIELSSELPVFLIGVGWKKLGELVDKNVYVVLKGNIKTNLESNRAANMGYNIVRACSKSEMDLINIIIGAKDFVLFPKQLLKSITTTIQPINSKKLLLNTAGEIIGLMLKNTNLDHEVQNQNKINNTEYSLYSQSKFHKTSFSKDLGYRIEYNCKIPLNLSNEQNNHNYNNTDCEHSEPGKYVGDYLVLNDIKLALCELDRKDINALTNPDKREIFINLRSPIIKKILCQTPMVQKALMLEEMSHELAHIFGYGLIDHDTEFFQKQRILKYNAILNL